MKRKYKCIGLEESIVTHWNARFTIGEEYEVCNDDTASKHLFLYDDDSNKCYVDSCQFVMVPEVDDCNELIALAMSYDPELTEQQADFILNCGTLFKLEPRCQAT